VHWWRSGPSFRACPQVRSSWYCECWLGCPLGRLALTVSCVQSPKKVGDDIQAATKAWKGIKVVVKVTIQNRMASVEVTPTSSALIIKALGISRDRKKEKNPSYSGTITMEQVLEVARTIRDKSQSRTFAGTVKEVLGTCFSIGCNINGEHPRDVQAKIDSGEITVGDA
jgi:large subunit ribosomal protein L12e